MLDICPLNHTWADTGRRIQHGGKTYAVMQCVNCRSYQEVAVDAHLVTEGRKMKKKGKKPLTLNK